jgi:hypothetical protein
MPASRRGLVLAAGGGMKNLAVGLLCMLLLTACNVSFSTGGTSALPEPTAGTAEQRLEAEAAARSYLGMIDREEFQRTWDQSGPALRAQSSEFAWKNMLKLAVKTLGSSRQRELDGCGFSTRIDASVPEGEYVLVQFKSASGSTTTTEKMVMQKDQSQWKIIGYFVTKHAEYRPGT